MHSTPVSSIMTEEVITVTRYMSVHGALEIMLANSIKRLPVVGVDTNRVVGIISRSDARTSLLKHHGDGGDPPLVSDAMTVDVHCLKPDDNVGRAIDLMVTHHVSGLPVVEGRTPIGIVTTTDILRLVTQHGASIQGD